MEQVLKGPPRHLSSQSWNYRLNYFLLIYIPNCNKKRQTLSASEVLTSTESLQHAFSLGWDRNKEEWPKKPGECCPHRPCRMTSTMACPSIHMAAVTCKGTITKKKNKGNKTQEGWYIYVNTVKKQNKTKQTRGHNLKCLGKLMTYNTHEDLFLLHKIVWAMWQCSI